MVNTHHTLIKQVKWILHKVVILIGQKKKIQNKNINVPKLKQKNKMHITNTAITEICQIGDVYTSKQFRFSPTMDIVLENENVSIRWVLCKTLRSMQVCITPYLYLCEINEITRWPIDKSFESKSWINWIIKSYFYYVKFTSYTHFIIFPSFIVT